jgi:hypothetical protein
MYFSCVPLVILWGNQVAQSLVLTASDCNLTPQRVNFYRRFVYGTVGLKQGKIWEYVIDHFPEY